MSIVGRFVMFSHRSDDTFDSTFAAKNITFAEIYLF